MGMAAKPTAVRSTKQDCFWTAMCVAPMAHSSRLQYTIVREHAQRLEADAHIVSNQKTGKMHAGAQFPFFLAFTLRLSYDLVLPWKHEQQFWYLQSIVQFITIIVCKRYIRVY